MNSRGRVAVYGFGAIGSGVALALKRCGYEVSVWLRDVTKLSLAKQRVNNADAWFDAFDANVATAGAVAGNIQFVADARAATEDASVAIECISEDLEAKARLLEMVAPLLLPGGFLATTTSGLRVTEIASASHCPDRLVGLHFWNPPELMPLVEIIPGDNSPPHLISEARTFVESTGKTGVVVRRDIPGFIGNRLLHALWREAIYLVEIGVAAPEEIDLVARQTFGLRSPAIGPLENMDIVGLDLVETIHQYLLPELASSEVPQAGLVERVRRGELGLRTGKGFYEWSATGRSKVIERRDQQIVRAIRTIAEDSTMIVP